MDLVTFSSKRKKRKKEKEEKDLRETLAFNSACWPIVEKGKEKRKINCFF